MWLKSSASLYDLINICVYACVLLSNQFKTCRLWHENIAKSSTCINPNAELRRQPSAATNFFHSRYPCSVQFGKTYDLLYPATQEVSQLPGTPIRYYHLCHVGFWCTWIGAVKRCSRFWWLIDLFDVILEFSTCKCNTLRYYYFRFSGHRIEFSEYNCRRRTNATLYIDQSHLCDALVSLVHL